MTNRDQLNRLKEPYRTQAFENVNEHHSYPTKFLYCKSVSFKQTLKTSFNWENTPEGQGVKYWSNICKNPQNYLTDEAGN